LFRCDDHDGSLILYLFGFNFPFGATSTKPNTVEVADTGDDNENNQPDCKEVNKETTHVGEGARGCGGKVSGPLVSGNAEGKVESNGSGVIEDKIPGTIVGEINSSV
jgi:hypothetical protein